MLSVASIGNRPSIHVTHKRSTHFRVENKQTSTVKKRHVREEPLLFPPSHPLTLPPSLTPCKHRIDLWQIWTYEGRHVSNPRFQNLRAEYLSGRAISLSGDAVAILDRTSPKSIRVCDVSTGRPLADGRAPEVVHDSEVVS